MTATLARLPVRLRRHLALPQAVAINELPDWTIDWQRDRWGVLSIAALFFLFWLGLELAPWR